MKIKRILKLPVVVMLRTALMPYAFYAGFLSRNTYIRVTGDRTFIGWYEQPLEKMGKRMVKMNDLDLLITRYGRS